ncbi:hypothetical protein PG993_012080 [Apiospora rasikravindrae]|uniref:Uncharacterized protein n=1 Tax=Apiospora rasikravindrae TaxID=990691 RepID=A0ABR1S1H5_9PEZI
MMQFFPSKSLASLERNTISNQTQFSSAATSLSRYDEGTLLAYLLRSSPQTYVWSATPSLAHQRIDHESTRPRYQHDQSSRIFPVSAISISDSDYSPSIHFRYPKPGLSCLIPVQNLDRLRCFPLVLSHIAHLRQATGFRTGEHVWVDVISDETYGDAAQLVGTAW